MTAIRKSAIIAKENSFGSDTGVGDYYQLPPGAYVSFTVARQASSIYEAGNKMRADTQYGSLSCQWSITYVQDYTHLELLSLFFDYDSTVDSVSIGSTSPQAYKHTFKKKNGKRPPSFRMIVKQMDKMVDGNEDEITTLKGMVCKSLSISRSSSGSQMNVSLEGYAQIPETALATLVGTDWSEQNDNSLIQYSCMFLGGNTAKTSIVGEVDQHSMSIDNSLHMSNNICTPLVTKYGEGNCTFQWNASTYDNDVHKFKMLPNSGGSDADTFNSTTCPSGNNAWKLTPMKKGLRPAKNVYFISSENDMFADQGSKTWDTGRYFEIHAKDSTIKSMTWQKGDGQRMMQNLSSVECTSIEIEVRNNNSNAWPDSHKMIQVSFETGTGGSSVPDQYILKGNKAVNPGTPTKDGYTFNKWVTTDGGSTEFNFDNTTINETTTVYAKWTQNANSGSS